MDMINIVMFFTSVTFGKAAVTLTSVPSNGVINLPLTFTCDVNTLTPLAVLWSKTTLNNTNIPVATLNATCHHLVQSSFTRYTYTCGATTFNLTIPANSMTLDEDGLRWRCNVIDGSLQSSNMIYLSVSVPINNISLRSIPRDASPVHVIAGVHSRFQCSTNTNSKPSAIIQWYKGTTNLTSQGSDHISVSFSKTDSELNCKGWNNVTKSPYPKSAKTINILYPPTIQTMSSKKIIQGDTLTVQCTISSANPMPLPNQYSWKQIDGPLTQTGQSLVITVVQIPHAGSYQCTAVNTMIPTNGQIQQGSDLNSFNLDVLYPPRLTSINNQREPIGESLNITCGANANPMPSDNQFTWTKLNDVNFKQIGRILFISNIQRSDAGTYVCTVFNLMHPTDGTSQKGRGSTQFVLDVLYKPSLSSNNSNISVIKGQSNITLTCEVAAANPSYGLKYMWIKSGKEVGTTQHLTIDNVNRSHDGIYICRVTNSVGTSDPSEVHLSVLYPPVIASAAVNNSNTAPEGSTVYMKCLLDSNPPSKITWMNLYSQTILKTDGNVTQSRFMIRSTTCRDTGKYMCSAYNGIGRSSTRTLNLDIFCSPKLLERTGNIEEVGAILGSKVEISLSIISNPDPTIKWFYQKSQETEKRPVLFAAVEIQNSGIIFTTKLKKDLSTEDDFGLYTASVLNSHGSLEHTFRVVEKSNTGNTAIQNSDGLSVGSITLFVTSAVLCGIAVSFFTVTVVIKRRMKQPSIPRNTGRDGDAPFYDDLNADQINKNESTYEELQVMDANAKNPSV